MQETVSPIKTKPQQEILNTYIGQQLNNNDQNKAKILEEKKNPINAAHALKYILL